ncbi:zinc-dependent metalloprotease [Pedobacter sp. Du54]|uniref:zinc-dependent metalloprotease n=1 Tax=Pedobacter anseongensis TaxID=3133439 RepID=UPI0030958CAD
MKIFSSLLIAFLLVSTVSFAQTKVANLTEFTQNFKKFEGYFNFYYDEKTGKIYLAIDKLDREFLYFGSLSTGVGNGGPERGQASSLLLKFSKEGNKILLMQPVTNYRADSKDKDEMNAVESNFAKSVVFGFVPVAASEGTYLIDLTPFIVRDSQGIGSRLGASVGRGASTASYKVDETRSVVYLPNTKNFPKNTEFEALITFAGSTPDIKAITVNMHQSFIELPEQGFEMRKFDPRSSSFQFSYLDFSAPMSEPIVKRTISRHRLQKKDPNAAMSEAIKPIVYYLSRGVPEPVKTALLTGGMWWNQAFEAAGFKNAFQFKELPEGADPMDIRYNVVNWITRSGSPARAFSFGSSYTDPRTGEIIKGVVTLGSDRHRQDYLIAIGLMQPYIDGKKVPKEIEALALNRIRQLSAHEIGHTLGFNHNFAASPKGDASVMDYPFPKFTLKADGTVDISNPYTNEIGSWDKRSVIWAYSQFKKGADENVELDKIMAETLKQGYEYIPDIGGNAHPGSNQWETGKNTLVQMENILKVRRKVLDDFSEKAIPAGAPMATLEEVLVPIYLLHRYQVEAVAKALGGLYFTHAVKNDGQIPTKMVAPEIQWQAFDLLMQTLTPDALVLSDALISKIPPRPSGYPSSIENFRGNTGPTFDPIAAAETAVNITLSYLLNEERAARLIEYKARDNKQPGFLAVLDKLIEKTWKAPLPDGYKGELQVMVNNEVLKYLLALAGNTGAAKNVRGQALLKIEELKLYLTTRMIGGSPTVKANMWFALSQIEAFKTDPSKFTAPATVATPPGAPIGMPGINFLKDEEW